MNKKNTRIAGDSKPAAKTYTCYARFDDDAPEVVSTGIEYGIAFELTPSPNVFNLDKKKRIKHSGSMEFRSGSGKMFTLFLVEDQKSVV